MRSYAEERNKSPGFDEDFLPCCSYLVSRLVDTAAYGVESASQTYYGKSADELSVEEAAQLTAIPKGPSIYFPFINPERAEQRKDLVLSEMHRTGKIPSTMYEESKTIPVSFLTDGEKEVAIAPYYMEEARNVKRSLLHGPRWLLEGFLGGRTRLRLDVENAIL